MTKNKPLPPWQDARRLASGDRTWILTDVEECSSSFLPWSKPQRLFKVGAFDLRSKCLGFFTFSLDDVRGMLRAGIPSAPWAAPQTHGIEITRLAHDDGEEKGRFVVTVDLLDVPPELQAIASVAKNAFWHAAHTPNATPGMWKDLVDAVDREQRIEAAALGMTGLFTASDVQAIVGVGVNVLAVLKKLVKGEKLQRFGQTRGTRYRVR